MNVNLDSIGRSVMQKLDRRMQRPPTQPKTRVAVQDDGAVITNQHRILNFQGPGVIVSDESDARRTNIFIPGAPAAGSTVAVVSSTAARALSLWNGSSNNSPPSNWETLAFVDSGWSAAVAASTQGNAGYDDAISGTAQISATSTPTATNEQVLIRHHFTLADGAATSATLSMKVDDEVQDVYLNGTRLTITVGYAIAAATVSPSLSLFVMGGDNVLAVRFRSTIPTRQWLDYRIDMSVSVAAPVSNLTVAEVDGTPSVANVNTLRVSNGTLTNVGGGIVSLTTSTLTVEEQDGTPSVVVNRIKFANNSVTDEGGGVVSVAAGAGGAGGNIAYTGAGSAEPGSPASGDLYFATSGIPSIERYSGSIWVPFGPIYRLTVPLAVSNWTWINQGTGSATDQLGGGIYLLAPAAAGNNVRLLKRAAPSTPYTITAIFLPNLYPSTSQNCGLAWRQSSDGKLIVFAAVSTPKLGVSKYNSPTAFGAVYLNPGVAGTMAYGGVVCMRIADDGTNRICSLSTDGVNFIQIHSIGRTDFMTADEVGFYAESTDGNGAAAITLLSWVVG